MNIIMVTLSVIMCTIIVFVIGFKLGVYATGEAIKEMEKQGKITLKK